MSYYENKGNHLWIKCIFEEQCRPGPCLHQWWLSIEGPSLQISGYLYLCWCEIQLPQQSLKSTAGRVIPKIFRRTPHILFICLTCCPLEGVTDIGLPCLLIYPLNLSKSDLKVQKPKLVCFTYFCIHIQSHMKMHHSSEQLKMLWGKNIPPKMNAYIQFIA